MFITELYFHLNLKMGKSKIYQLKLSDVIIQHGKDKYPIDQSAYYQALISNDGEIYENEVNKSKHQRRKDSGTWKGFLKLREKLIKHGYYPSISPILINIKKKPYVSHGRHRIVLLMHIYGPKLKLVLQIKNGVGEVIDLSY